MLIKLKANKVGEEKMCCLVQYYEIHKYTIEGSNYLSHNRNRKLYSTGKIEDSVGEEIHSTG